MMPHDTMPDSMQTRQPDDNMLKAEKEPRKRMCFRGSP